MSARYETIELPGRCVRLLRTSPQEKSDHSLLLFYHWVYGRFGWMMVAASARGLCYLSFEGCKRRALENIKAQFPNALLEARETPTHRTALGFFSTQQTTDIDLHLFGTDFQFEVWRALLRIPFGKRSSYLKLAQAIGQPKSVRAVGTAIGRNPIAFIIPCHRVLQTSGGLGGYRWGLEKKAAILAWEAREEMRP